MIQHIAMVFQAGGLNHSEKALLFAYCNHTNGRGYCPVGIQRLADESGMSVRTVKRTNVALKAKGLIKSARRVNPRTGAPIPNLTRVNLVLLASMRRTEPDYDDDLIEALTFPEDDADQAAGSAQVGTGVDLAQGSDLLMCQSDTDLGGNLSPTPCQSVTDLSDDLAPNPFPSSVHTDPDPEEAETARTEDKPSPAVVEVSEETLRQAAEIASRLDLARLDAKPKQVIQITRALAEALRHPAADAATLERYAAATVATGHKVKYLLNGLSPERLTIGLPAYQTAEAQPSTPAEDCPVHPGATRRADGECAGCWTDRLDADPTPARVPRQADAPAQEMTTTTSADAIAHARAAMAALRGAPADSRR